jgi:hypothetical protein
MRLIFITLLLLSSFHLSAQRNYKLNSDREFPDYIFHGSFGYVYDGQGLQNKARLAYFLKRNLSIGLSLNYFKERFKDGPASLDNCNFWFSEGRASQEMHYLSIPVSFYFGGKSQDLITFSVGPAAGMHNYPKEFITGFGSTFIGGTSCTRVIYTRDYFVGIDTQIDFNIKIGDRTGIFIGSNILTMFEKSPRIIFHFGFLVDFF